MGRKTRAVDALQKVSQHLHYEVGMLIAVAHGLSSGIASGSPANNALLESFAVHLRNLVEFLWPEKAKADAVIAADFFPSPGDWDRLRPPIPSQLRKARVRAAKEVAHLTYARLLVTPDTKAWAFVSLANEIMKGFNVFLKHVPRDRLGSSWKQTTHFSRGGPAAHAADADVSHQHE